LSEYPIFLPHHTKKMANTSFVTSIDLDSLEYKQPLSQKHGAKVVYVSTVPNSTDWKDRMRFQMSEDAQTNLQSAVWGLSTPLQGQDQSRRTLELTVESPSLFDFLKKLDEKNIESAFKYSETWFKKQLDKTQLEQMYVRVLKERTKEEYKDTVRVKVKCQDYPTNIWLVDDIDENGKIKYSPGGPDDLTKGVKLLALVETSGLWFMSRQFGMSLTATDLLVWPNKRPSGINAFNLGPGKTLIKTNKSESESEMEVEMRFE
jgi:hypothetical protein